MRISLITRQKIECLSIRLEDVPGLDISTAEKLEVILVGDKSKKIGGISLLGIHLHKEAK